MGRLIQLLAGWLAGQAGPTLARVASSLSTTVGRTVGGTVDDIIKAITEYVGSNPLKASVVLNTLASFGFYVAEDTLTDLLPRMVEETVVDGKTVAKIDGVESEAMAVMLAKVRSKLREQRARHTGDGNADTVNGREISEVVTDADYRAAVFKDIDLASRVLGSFELLRVVRRVMFIEDADLDSYERIMM